jgi:hypothetical protein
VSGLRREQMRIGLQVGLREGGNGERLHGSIDKLDHTGAFVWVPDPRYSTALPRALRGFLTKLSYELAEAGAMWTEPATACGPMPTGPTGADLIAFLAWAKATGAVAEQAATGYRNAARHVLAAQSDGDATDITADPAEAIARFTTARRSALAPATLAQYASGYRRARAIYLEHLAAAACDTARLNVALGDRRAITLTVTTPDTLTDAERSQALGALTRHLAAVPTSASGAAAETGGAS